MTPLLGHAKYYPRFGFTPSSRYGIRCEYDVPEEVFMVMELQPGYLSGASGTIKYHAAFSNVWAYVRGFIVRIAVGVELRGRPSDPDLFFIVSESDET